jgi:hypothetical protein
VLTDAYPSALRASSGAARRGLEGLDLGGLDATPPPTHNRIIQGKMRERALPSSRRPTMAISLKVNGATRSVDAEPDTPLLYVLRNDLELNGAKYGCAMTQCGACTVLVNGAADAPA